MELVVLDLESGPWSVRLQELAFNEKRISSSMFFRTTDALFHHLRTLARSTRLVVLLGAGMDLFSDPYCARNLIELLEGVSLVLVLVDDDPETVSNGHRLRPRYVTFMDREPEDFVKVMDGIIGKIAPDVSRIN